MANTELDAPPATATSSGGTLVGGAIAAILADASDATYYQMDGTANTVNVTAFTASIPAGAQIRYVDFVVRHDYQIPLTQPTYQVGIGGGLVAVNQPLPATPFLPAGTLSDVVIGPFSTDINGNIISIGAVAGIQFWLFKNGPADVVRVAKVTMRVFYNAKPSAPTVSLDLDDLATVSIGYSDPEADPLEAVQVAIFTDAVKTGGGFDPATSTAVYRSGTTYVSAASGATVVHATGQRILAGGTYWAYVRVSDAGSAGRWSDWANASTVLVFDVPAPVVLAADDPTNGCVVLRVIGQYNLAQDDSFETAPIVVTFTGATAARSTDHAADGTWSAKATVSGSNLQMDPTTSAADLDLGYGIPWVFAVSIWPVGAGKSAYVYMDWTDGGANNGTLPAVLAPVALTAGQWNRIVVSGYPTAGVGVRSFTWHVQVTPDSPGDIVYFDKLSFHPGLADNYSARRPNRNAPGTTRWVLQRSDDGGTTWVDVSRLYAVPEMGGALVDRTFMATPVGSNNTEIALVRDFEAPRGRAVQYRARVYEDNNATDPGSGPWSATTSVSTDAQHSTWLKDPSNPAIAWHGYVDGHVKASQKETQEVHEILDATRPVVVTGPILGDVLQGRFLALTDAKREQIKALRALQRTLLLQVRDGRQWYVRLGPVVDIEPTDDMDPALWAMDFQAVEVAAP
jgi:hypothetical protein